jgi:hypothetical protein
MAAQGKAKTHLRQCDFQKMLGRRLDQVCEVACQQQLDSQAKAKLPPSVGFRC